MARPRVRKSAGRAVLIACVLSACVVVCAIVYVALFRSEEYRRARLHERFLEGDVEAAIKLSELTFVEGNEVSAVYLEDAIEHGSKEALAIATDRADAGLRVYRSMLAHYYVDIRDETLARKYVLGLAEDTKIMPEGVIIPKLLFNDAYGAKGWREIGRDCLLVHLNRDGENYAAVLLVKAVEEGRLERPADAVWAAWEEAARTADEFDREYAEGLIRKFSGVSRPSR